MNRISVKAYKNCTTFIKDKSSLSLDFKLDKNNIYSSNELILLKWLEVNYK